MPQLTPIQESFSAGEISPLMYQRSSTEGYQQGLSELTNMFADSRGPAYSRAGSRYVDSYAGGDARIVALPVNDNFFYSGIFLENRLIMASMVGHNPDLVYSLNANFNLGDNGDWVKDTQGGGSQVNITFGNCFMQVRQNSDRHSYISQEITQPTGIYDLDYSLSGDAVVNIKVGLTEDSDDFLTFNVSGGISTVQFTSTGASFWITARIDGDSISTKTTDISYLGVSGTGSQTVEFVTPYLEIHLSALQAIQSPSGGDVYILHELYPPYKLHYDNPTDTFTWAIVEFKDDSGTDPDICDGASAQPPEWIVGSYPSAGDFFEGRLWLGGTVNEPQTFWASKSGCPEVFVATGDGTNADDPLQFTMAKYGRIEWMVGFKNLVIGTQNGEHIVTSAGGFISPSDIQVQQQSSYGSANIQPVQVGDQIFYVSSDRRKLRSIQYEWQKDNWLSKDLTFNSEHITKAGIKHITWQQNPKNLFHCVLEDGTLASLTYERSHNVYGWSQVSLGDGMGVVKDATTGALEGTDFMNAIVQYKDDVLNYEIQPDSDSTHYMDSWVDGNAEPDLVTVVGLDHLEGFTVQVLVEFATHPDRIVVGGQITLQYEVLPEDVITVGLKYTPKLVTLPFDQGAPAGSGAGWQKRWNKIYTRLLNSTMPLINGERQPERFPSTPMNETQPPINEEVLKVNLGYDRHAIITIEQDLPHRLVVLGVFGELSQSKL